MPSLATLMITDRCFKVVCDLSANELDHVCHLIEYTGDNNASTNKDKEEHINSLPPHKRCNYRRIDPWHKTTRCSNRNISHYLCCKEHTELERLWCQLYHSLQHPLVEVYQRTLMSCSLFGTLDFNHLSYVLNIHLNVPTQKTIELLNWKCLPKCLEHSPQLLDEAWKDILLTIVRRGKLNTVRTIIIGDPFSSSSSDKHNKTGHPTFTGKINLADICWYLDCRLKKEVKLTSHMCYFGAFLGGNRKVVV